MVESNIIGTPSIIRLNANHMSVGFIMLPFIGSTLFSTLFTSLVTRIRALLLRNSMDQLEVLPSVSRVRTDEQLICHSN
jgi:hypothetical protein